MNNVHFLSVFAAPFLLAAAGSSAERAPVAPDKAGSIQKIVGSWTAVARKDVITKAGVQLLRKSECSIENRVMSLTFYNNATPQLDFRVIRSDGGVLRSDLSQIDLRRLSIDGIDYSITFVDIGTMTVLSRSNYRSSDEPSDVVVGDHYMSATTFDGTEIPVVGLLDRIINSNKISLTFNDPDSGEFAQFSFDAYGLKELTIWCGERIRNNQ
ncbi:hypothetical protein M2337_003394 [Sphingobium sp. B2D3A]|uniref:hypothetical protein n=1 Tax=unclassified Sphingobium TaxID=2611147 RepID=UPI0022257AE5|nr:MULTISPECIES: hypothetical protein [unclassified Sphingobium]MCW2339104.1 hypothetical protein [Sphingobium sp. B2D3A]MCW2386953.1 hypothetical protein [Sphingobium sp. B2D3D]